MSKIIALFIFSSLCLFVFYPNDSSSKNLPATVSPTPTPNVSSDLFRIETDRETVGGSCPKYYKCTGDCDDSPLIITVVSNAKPENNAVRYSYQVSGGNIVGKGAKVGWNLKGAQPGTYEIKVDVTDEKSGNLLQSITKIITAGLCNDNGDRCLVCPEFSVDAPNAPVQAGETMDFTANIRGGTWSTFKYFWKVSDGKIIEGQGTPTIKVATTRTMAGKTIEATVKFEWDCSDICEDNTVSAKVLVAATKRKEK